MSSSTAMKVALVLVGFVVCAFANPTDNNGLANMLAADGGVSSLLNPTNLIVGGHVATIESFPWIVSLRRFGNHRCGANVISVNRVLTAAHCTDGIDASTLTIQAGSTIIGHTDGQIIAVSDIKEHFAYGSRNLDNDIAVLHLAGSLTLGPTVQVIALPSQGATVENGAKVEVAGWGAVHNGGPVSNQLRYVTVPIVSHSICNVRYSGGITAGMLCAGKVLGGSDSCQGDSGGPMTLDGELIGLVSFGSGCGNPFTPSVYARVAYYRNWINSVL